jgi:hypothetical protein
MVLLHTHDGGEARCPLERVLLVESDEAIARSAR